MVVVRGNNRRTHMPVAVDLDRAAGLLGVPLADVRRAAARVEPYTAADGSLKWPLRELARWLAGGTGRIVPRGGR